MDKYNKTITVSELKQGLKTRFEKIAGKIDSHDRMQIAINLKIDLATVKRYVDGKIEDIRRLELAEKIMEQAEKIAKNKKPVTA